MKISRRARALAVPCVLLPIVALAQVPPGAKTVPGEKWRTKMSVQMEGMSMPMGTQEVCAPAGRANEALAKPDPKNCTVSDVKNAGRSFSAKVKCTGKDAIEGTIEQTVEGPDHVSGRMRARMSGDEVTMVFDSQKLGACQALDVESLKPAPVALPKPVDACASIGERFAKDASQLGSAFDFYVGPKAECGRSPANAPYCKALQTRAGFASVSQRQRSTRDTAAMLRKAGQSAGDAGPGADALVQSFAACGLGGDAAIVAARAGYVKSAEASGDWQFLVAEAPDRARALAKRECVARGEMMVSRSGKLDAFCDSNFAADVH